MTKKAKLNGRGHAKAPAAKSVADELPAGTSRVIEVTPAMAERWLTKNHPDNREVVWTRVESFTNDIRAGAWQLTHQGIAFDTDGLLIDGQHRLHAVVASGISVRMLVTHGIGHYGDPIDCGRPRSIALLSGFGNKQTGAINALRMLEVGYRLTTPMTLHEAKDISEHHAEALAAIPNTAKMGSGIFGACAYAYPIASEQVVQFAISYTTGEMLRRGDPAFSLRNWKERLGFSRDSWTLALATLNCIRYHVLGEPLAMVYTGSSGYRAVTGRRRVLKVPHTPSTDLVASLSFSITRGEREETA